MPPPDPLPPQDPTSAFADDLVAAGLPVEAARRLASGLPASYVDEAPRDRIVADLIEIGRLASEHGEGPGTGRPAPDVDVRFRFEPASHEPADVEADAMSDSVIGLVATHRGGRLELSRLVPILERLGFWVADGQHWDLDRGWTVHRLRLRLDRPGEVAAEGDRWAAAVQACWDGQTEVDELNGLVTVSRLDWSDVAVLRALVGYRLQVDRLHRLDQVAAALVRHPDVAAGIVELFELRLHPQRRDLDRGATLATELERACDAVERLDDDRILRGLIGTVTAAVRTTCWRSAGPMAVKFDPAAVPGIPSPVPAHETWVSGRLRGGGSVRGIHLRAGAIARGGIRWSDRPDDLRSEVLDLMATQVLKNAPIVPTGAKGGFVVEGGDGAAAYDAFVGALLDLTDDRDGEEVVAVDGRLDGDDTYLVVAADRGTASFSDRANRLAHERGYWLGDAFASGGSNGYDHKALGVTARGAWEAVRHHFELLGVDPTSETVTMVGIGDMSGDVFGNFLLRSPHLALVAAFDHRHVLVDPDPDPAAAFEERRRLATLPRSSWDDYDRDLLSPEGFVVARTEKRVGLGPRVRELLRVEAEVLTPAELIQAVLRAPVDLLFAGGVGTFVRAAEEDDRTIDDRANAELRVTAEQLRARVVGEGANLAFTQAGRIEYARRGGRINLDAIDNAAGVDTSDHEVNLKILLDLAVGDGLLDRDERNRLLHEHTDAVVDHVLERVRRQCARLSYSEVASGQRPDWFETLLERLVAGGVLDPAVSVLPDADELASRRVAGAGLTRPELGVMLSGVKRWHRAQVVASDLPEQAASRGALADAFPDAISRRFDTVLGRHPLRRELVASALANEVVDRLGLTFVHRISADTGAAPAAVVAAAMVATGVVDARTWWEHLASPPVGALVDPELVDGRRLVVELCEHLTRSELARFPDGPPDVAARVAADRPVAEEVALALGAHAGHEQRRRRAKLLRELTHAGWDRYVATELAVLPELHLVPDVAALARELDRSPTDVVAAHAVLDDALHLVRLADDLDALPVAGRWPRAARDTAAGELTATRNRLLATLLAEGRDHDGATAAREHLEAHDTAVGAALRLQREVQSDPEAGLAGLMVAVRALRGVG